MGLRILFSVRKPSNVRQFESVLRALAARGHDVMLVREALGEFDWPPFVLALAESCPGIRLETMPSAAKTHWWELATRFRNATNFLRDLLKITPLPWDPAKANTIDPPYPQPKVTYGWAAGDACYAMGGFELSDDEVLILEGTSPPCAFWNMCLWNPYMQTYDYRYERVTINGGQVEYEPDGSWQIAIAARDPGRRNWVSTAGHPRGRIWFRWFLAESLPSQPKARVEKI